MKTALVYDWINKWGGAERILLALHEIFPKAPLYTAVYDAENAPWAEVFDIKTSFLQKMPPARKNHEYFLPFLPFAFESFNFDSCDLVVSLSSSFAKSIITKPQTVHINYCLTPTRYLWSGYQDYFSADWQKTASSIFVSRFKKWDKIASSRPDFYIAISKNVQQRIKNYYQRDSEVVYPPVEFSVKEKEPARKIENFFLIAARLVKYKKIDMAVKAFRQLDHQLVIIGEGREEQRLKRLAGRNIFFLRHLTEGELSWYYRHCWALIMPQEEDFGMSAVEAQLKGKPVIAYKGGGALETVIEGKTGMFFYPQTVEDLKKAVRNFQRKKYKSQDCIANAERFTKGRFKSEFTKLISEYMSTKK